MTASEVANKEFLGSELLKVGKSDKDLPLSVVSIAACSILVYIMGRFYVAELFNLKRILEIILLIPILAYVVVFAINGIFRLKFDPLIFFVLQLLFNSILFSMDFLRVADLIFSLLALIVIASAPMRSIYTGVKWVIGIATFFSILAIIEWFILLVFPQLSVHAEVVASENGLSSADFHPIMLLGLVTGEEYVLFGFDVTRLRSFASEPSLLNVFFLIPASLSLILNNKFWRGCGVIILLFCLLSLSGSVFLSLAFSALYFVLSFFLRPKILFFFLPITILSGFLVIIITQGVESFMALNSSIVQYGDFLDKASSFNTRNEGIILAFEAMQKAPFGSAVALDLPAPLFFSAMVKGGVIAVVLILVFIFKLSIRVQAFTKIKQGNMLTKMSIALFFGVICTAITFNDYSMLNYVGLVLLMFFYRLLEIPASKE
jgi:hypothetical protein